MKGGVYPNYRGGWQVRFGSLTKSFKHKKDAQDFWMLLNFKNREGSLDLRDYRSGNPLGFATLAEKWLDVKQNQIKRRTWVGYKRIIKYAIEAWGQTNVKDIRKGHIEDFIFKGNDWSSKTRHETKIILKQFFGWVAEREGFPMPKFPKTSFEMGWRNIIDVGTQSRIIHEVREISYEINPKIWYAIKSLSTYISIRPGELISIKEKQINLKSECIIIPHPKEKRPKVVYLLEQDVEWLKSIPRGLPDLHFFRHNQNITSVKAGQRFGDGYLRTWWKRACNNLGIEGVDLYGGTRHSTVMALGKICTPEQIKDATGHVSPAFERYFQVKQARALKVTEKIKEMSDGNTKLHNINFNRENGG